MSVLVKICGLTDKVAVDAAVASGADAVGFVFARSVRAVTPARALELAADVPDGVLKVAVMLHPEAALWNEVRDVFQPDVLQTDASDFSYLEVPTGMRRWPVVREGDHDEQLPDEFLYEGVTSGHGQQVDWEKASQLARRGRMILAGGLDAGNVARAVEQVSPYGVDVSSAIESSPGRKDPLKIRAFIDAAKAA